MINATKIPGNLVEVHKHHNFFEAFVEKRTLEGIDEIQQLSVTPYTSIIRHGHNQQWEVWINLAKNEAYVCLIGEEHQLVNNSKNKLSIMAIKGHINYTYEDLRSILIEFGFLVKRGSLIINDKDGLKIN